MPPKIQPPGAPKKTPPGVATSKSLTIKPSVPVKGGPVPAKGAAAPVKGGAPPGKGAAGAVKSVDAAVVETPLRRRVKKPIKKPVYEAPRPVITRKWIPPDERPKPPKSPPKYEAPRPVITRRWIPPDRRKKPPPPPKYEPPALPPATKHWIPPDKRKKPKKPEPKCVPPSPPGKTLHVPHTSIPKGWGSFKFYDGLTEVGYLIADYSMAHKKFGKNAGLQDMAISIVCCGISKVLDDMHKWGKDILHSMIISGHHLYEESKKKMECKEAYMDIGQMLPYFYVGSTKLLVEIDTTITMLEDIADCDKVKKLMSSLKLFFSIHESGVLTLLGKSFCVFQVLEKGFNCLYFFDPSDHTSHGQPMKARPLGQGCAVVGKTMSLKKLVSALILNLPPFVKTKLSITPVKNLKVEKIAVDAPKTYEEVIEKKIPEKQECKKLDDDKKKEEVKKGKGDKKTETDAEKEALAQKAAEAAEKLKRMQTVLEINPNAATIENKPSFLKDMDMEKIITDKQAEPVKTADEMALQNVKPKPISRYVDLVPGKVGILRGKTHQKDKTFTKYDGKQSMGNSIACFTMLRFHKAKRWISRLLDDIHLFGELYYNAARKHKPPTFQLRLQDFPEKHEMNKVFFKLEYEENACFGQLNSDEFEILDLRAALENFLINNTCALVHGPITVAVWKEDGIFYMFDPNERDEKGRKMSVLSAKPGDMETPKGASCVLWFANLDDLCTLYTSNVKIEDKKDYFSISSIRIKDDPQIPLPFYNFLGFKKNRWIIMADYCQDDARFESPGRGVQCTAMAAMSVIWANIKKNFTVWSKSTLSDILQNGDKFYRDSLIEIKKSKPDFEHVLLCADELKTKTVFPELEKQVQMNTTCPVFGFVKLTVPLDGVNDLRHGILKFFEDYTYGVCTAGQISVGFWRASPKEYYYFDSHSRNSQGLSVRGGRACLIRTTTAEELVKCMLPNIPCAQDGQFNLYELGIKVTDVVKNLSRPPQNFYVPISVEDGDLIVILRGFNSQTSPKFVVYAGKQSIPMCVLALAYNRLRETCKWNSTDIDTILDKGNEYFTNSYVDREDLEQDFINTENIKKDFVVGYNKFFIEFETADSGNVKERLIETLATYYKGPPSVEEPYKETILETEKYIIGILRDQTAYYIFDPNPRDKRGNVIGKYDWDDPGEEGSGDLGDDSENDNENEEEKGGGDTGNEENIEDDDAPFTRKRFFKTVGSREWTLGKPSSAKSRTRKYPPSFWEDQVESYGRACAMRFLLIQDLVTYIYENIPPMERAEMEFKLHKVSINTEIVVVDKLRPESGEKILYMYDGDWFNFKEIEKGNWILSGTQRLYDEMFPKENRGKQELPVCVTFLTYCLLFPLNKYIPDTLDKILSYGDKLFSRIKRDQFQNLKANTSMRDDDINAIVQDTTVTVENIYKKIRIGKHYVRVEISSALNGHMFAAEDDEKVLDLKKGLDQFFEAFTFGILVANGLMVAIYKGATVFYMYDPHERGPDGKLDLTGSPCATRYLNMAKLQEVFMANIDKFGNNYYDIYSVILEEFKSAEADNQEVDIEEEKKLPQPSKPGTTALPGLTLGGWKKISGGKFILRGSLDNDIFSPVKTAAFSFISLAMSIIHKPSTWTYPLMTEIAEVSNDLFNLSRGEDDPPFDLQDNPLNLNKVKNNFNIGTIKCQVILRLPGVVGSVVSNNSKELNLKQGLDDLFTKNTHAIIETGGFKFAIWEEFDAVTGKPLIFLYDPVSRGATGMPISYGGKPCCLYFVQNTHMVSEHIREILEAELISQGQYKITAVEVVAGSKKSKKRDVITKPMLCRKLHTRHDINLTMKENELQEKLREEREIARLGRFTYHCVMPGEILRAYRNMFSPQYAANVRGRQELTCCIVACVMSILQSIEYWNCSTLDLLLDTGSQIFIDCYLCYRPDNVKLGMMNVLRKFYVRDEYIKLKMYQPLVTAPMQIEVFSRAIEQYFMDDRFGKSRYIILQYIDLYFSIFYSSGRYYMFDPHSTDHNGNLCHEKGTSVLYKFYKIEELVDRIFRNYSHIFDQVAEKYNVFNLHFMIIQTSKPKPAKTICDKDTFK